MAITITSNPQTYTPAFNANTFSVSSDNANILYFDAQVMHSGSTVSNLKIYPTPANKTGSTIDVSRIIDNHVHTTVKHNNNLFEYPDDLYQYEVKFTEQILTGSTIVSGATTTSDIVYTWNGGVPKVNYIDYDDSLYTDFGRPLTHKPNLSTTNLWQSEYLTFINSGLIDTIQFESHYYVNEIYDYYISQLPIDPSKKVCRIDISAFNHVHQAEYLKSLTISLMEGDTIRQTFTRNVQTDCFSPINLLFLNDLGGIDTLGVRNARETVNVSKVVSQASTEDVYQSFQHTLVNDTKSIYTVVTDWLSDAEYQWATSIAKSKAVFVELTTGRLLPIEINESSVKVEQRKYSDKPLQFEFTFEAESGLNVPFNDIVSDTSKVGFNGTTNYDEVISLPRHTSSYSYTLNSDGFLV